MSDVPDQYDVFVSYSSKDNREALELAEHLKQAGLLACGSPPGSS